MSTCAIDPERLRVVVRATLQGPTRSIEAKLLIDTGTPVTVVDGDIIHRLGYSPRDGLGRSRLLGTDDAGSEGWIIVVDALDVLGARHEPYRVHVHDMPRADGIDGLLGMDWLVQHVSMLDGPAGRLERVR